MNNPEKLATQVTQDEEKQNKNTTQYVLDTTMRKHNTNNVNKTSPPTYTTRSLVLCVCFVDRCLSFCTFSFGHCVV